MKEYLHTVQYYETDKMGVTHHSNYIRWMEEARVDFLDQLGWPYVRLEEEGLVSPVLAVECRYKAPTRFGDRIAVSVVLGAFKGLRMTLRYSMKNEEGRIVFQGRSEHAFLDRGGRPLRLDKVLPAFYEAMKALVEKEASVGE